MEYRNVNCTTVTRSRFDLPISPAAFLGDLVGAWSMTVKHVVSGVPVWSPPHC